MNFRLAQCPVVDAHIVNDPVKAITTAERAGALSNIYVYRSIDLCCWDGACQDPIIQHAVHIDVQRPGGGIVHSRNVIPHIQ